MLKEENNWRLGMMVTGMIHGSGQLMKGLECSRKSFSYRGCYFKSRVRVRRFFGFVLGGCLGGLSGKVLSDVCMGEGSEILIRFGGGWHLDS